MTSSRPRRAFMWRWAGLVLAALVAVLAMLLPVGTASATGLPSAETRVGAIHPTVTAVVGVAEHIAAGQHLGRAPSQLRHAVGHCVAAEDATSVIKGTNERGLVNSRPSPFRKPTTQGAWDNAEAGPTGGRLCPSCGGEVSVPPNMGVPRDWDVSHFPSWSNREFPSTIERPEILDNYNEGVSLECPACNRGAGNDDTRFGP